MPEYIYRCHKGHEMSRFVHVSKHLPFVDCERCGVIAHQVITAPLLVKAAADVSYDSPIDGRPITSWQARQEDLKRNGCREYDPGMRADYDRRCKESASELDASIEASVEEAVEKMSTSKRAKLYSELTEQGVSADVVRSTPNA